MLNIKSNKVRTIGVVALFVGVILFLVTGTGSAHKKRHSAADMKAFDDAYMEVVKMGDALFHGGGQRDTFLMRSKDGVWMRCG